jgi:hypothetical protein
MPHEQKTYPFDPNTYHQLPISFNLIRAAIIETMTIKAKMYVDMLIGPEIEISMRWETQSFSGIFKSGVKFQDVVDYFSKAIHRHEYEKVKKESNERIAKERAKKKEQLKDIREWVIKNGKISTMSINYSPCALLRCRYRFKNYEICLLEGCAIEDLIEAMTKEIWSDIYG